MDWIWSNFLNSLSYIETDIQPQLLHRAVFYLVSGSLIKCVWPNVMHIISVWSIVDWWLYAVSQTWSFVSLGGVSLLAPLCRDRAEQAGFQSGPVVSARRDPWVSVVFTVLLPGQRNVREFHRDRGCCNIPVKVLWVNNFSKLIIV